MWEVLQGQGCERAGFWAYPRVSERSPAFSMWRDGEEKKNRFFDHFPLDTGICCGV